MIPLVFAPNLISAVTVAFPFLPFLVVIKTTPFAPRAPYNALAAASFNTVIDSTSCWLIILRSPSKGTPSTTIKGLLDALIEPRPRTRILVPLPGCPDSVEICTPATAPSNALVTSDTCIFSILSFFTTAADPVKELFLAVP